VFEDFVKKITRELQLNISDISLYQNII